MRPFTILTVLTIVSLFLPTTSKQNCFDKLGIGQDTHPRIIKKKFRRLALKYHPDKVPESEREKAADKFKELARCYEIVSDDEKRQQYIASGYDEQFAETGQPSGGGGGGFNFGGFGDFGDMFSSFFSSHGFDHGGGRSGGGRQEFHFGGGNPGGGFGDFGGFGGGGSGRRRRQQHHSQDMPGGFGGGSEKPKKPAARTLKVTLSDILNGGTRKAKISVGGRPRKVEIKVPKGAKEGQTVTVEGRKFKLKCAKHRLFRRGTGMKATNLYYKAKISLLDALSGKATITVPTLDGDTEEIFLDEIVSPSSTRKILGRGLPKRKRPDKRGDLVVEFDILFPKRLSMEQQEEFFKMAHRWPWDKTVETNTNKEEL